MLHFTIMSSSDSVRCVSSMNCSTPPRRVMVAVLRYSHSIRKLYLSLPIFFSSKRPHSPSTVSLRSPNDVCTTLPVA